MITIDEQIYFFTRCLPDNTNEEDYNIMKAILESLKKLKEQENLIDQQADECNSGAIKRPVLIFPDNLKSNSEKMLESMEKEISAIKELTIKIANKFEVNLDNVHRDATAAIDELKRHADEKGYEVEAKDPTVLSLVGDVSRLPHSEIMRILGLISNDIAILEGLFNRGGMTVGERDGILDSMTYKTTDLDLLDRAAKYLQYYLPF